jgi:uncharacterized membrane protein
MTEKKARPWANLGTERIKSFSDGVFSIVITLLVLELHVPKLDEPHSGSELIWALLAIWPKFASYFASFIVIGIYWIAHHNFFHYVHHTNRNLLWLNNFYLMAVSLIAFSAAMLGSYPENKVAVFAYGLNLVLVGLALNALWHYGIRRKLVTEEHGLFVFRATRVIISVPVVLYAIAMGFSFVNLHVSLLLYVLVPLIYIIPGVLELILEASARASEAIK